MSAKIKDILIKIFVQIIFIIFSASILFSLYYLIVNSFKTEKQFAFSQFNLPGSFSFSNIINVWTRGNIGIAFKNSMILSISSVIVVLIVSVLGAYAFAWLRFRGRRILYFIIISTMFFSPMIIVIPLYLQFIKLGMLNQYQGVIIIYAGLRLAFSVFLLTTFFKGIPIEIMEAADIDGCTKLGVLRYVILPLSVPAILSLTLINFNACWNDLIIGILFLQKPEMQTLMVATAQFKGKIDSSPTSILAASLISTAVVMLIYGFTQKYFVKGLTLGSIK